MSQKSRRRIPKGCRHTASGQCVARLDGRDYYLGKFGTENTSQAYERLIAEWLSRERIPAFEPEQDSSGIMMHELCLAYWRHAEIYYRKHGKPPGAIPRIRVAPRLFRDMYGNLNAVDFGPRRLQAMPARLIPEGRARSYINDLVAIIRAAFQWATSQELVPIAAF